MEPALIALAGTLFGGVALKIIEHFLGRASKKEDLATTLRAELRADVARLREELREESTAAQEWQARYWELKASTLIANHKVDAVVEVVNEVHPDRQLKSSLDGLQNPDK